MTAANLRRPLVLAGVMSAMFMIAIEATIVSTAMPQIAAELGDLHLYAWVFAAFLLTQTATIIVFGKLSDMYGRKPVLLVGVALFLLGSLLCGFARSMTALILFRLIQGLGAGSIQPIALTVVGDLYPGEQRGKIQGYLSSVWGLSSLLGPLAGGLITAHFGWPWVFWINLPVGVVTAILFTRYLKETIARTERRIDVPGAILFAAATAVLLLALTELGEQPRLSATLLVGFLLLAWLFVRQERRAADPMVDFALYARSAIAVSNAVMLLAGMALIGLSAFLPMYVQAVLDQSPLVAGFALTAMSLGWPVGAFIASRLAFASFGLRRTLIGGAALLPLGGAFMLVLQPGVSPLVAGFGSLVMGVGMGLCSTASLVLIQGSVGWEQRGAVTSSNVFARMLGSTFGASVMGGVLNASLAARFPAVSFERIRHLLEHPGSESIDPLVQTALDTSLHLAFWSMFAMALAAAIIATLLPATKVAQPAE